MSLWPVSPSQASNLTTLNLGQDVSGFKSLTGHFKTPIGVFFYVLTYFAIDIRQFGRYNKDMSKQQQLAYADRRSE